MANFDVDDAISMFGDTVPLGPVIMNEEDVKKVCGWKYGLVKTKISSVIDGVEDSYDYELVEIYSSGGYAKDIRISGETINEVISQLETMLNDLRDYTEVVNARDE